MTCEDRAGNQIHCTMTAPKIECTNDNHSDKALKMIIEIDWGTK